MAITKIKPITATVRKAVDYITDPEKTDDGLLVSSFGCAPETADIEFDFTREQSRGIGKNLAYHMIQSFKADEISMQEAHRIGQELADKILKGQHEYVISTHIDKGHIHNHIIFNSVNYVTHDKYHDCKETYRTIRRTSDRLCRDNGLSVIKSTRGVRGKSSYEYQRDKEGKSWKSILKETIDKCISESESFEQFLQKMEECEYSIKHGKHISFKSADQERFCRSKTIGEFYTEEMIKNRISNKEYYKEFTEKETKANNNNKKNYSKKSASRNGKTEKINLIIDIENNIKCQQSAGYKYKMEIINLKEKTNTLNFLMTNGLNNMEKLNQYYQSIKADYNKNRRNISNIEKEINRLAETIKYATNYKKLKAVFEKSRLDTSGKFLAEHQQEVLLYEAAKRYFEENGINPDTFDISKAKADYKLKKEKKESLYTSYMDIKNKLKEIEIIRKNVETILNKNLNAADKDERESEQDSKETR